MEGLKFGAGLDARRSPRIESGAPSVHIDPLRVVSPSSSHRRDGVGPSPTRRRAAHASARDHALVIVGRSGVARAVCAGDRYLRRMKKSNAAVSPGAGKSGPTRVEGWSGGSGRGRAGRRLGIRVALPMALSRMRFTPRGDSSTDISHGLRTDANPARDLPVAHCARVQTGRKVRHLVAALRRLIT